MREYQATTRTGVERFDTYEEAKNHVDSVGSGEIVTFYMRKNPLAHLGAYPEIEYKCIGLRMLDYEGKWWGIDVFGSGRKFPIEDPEREY